MIWHCSLQLFKFGFLLPISLFLDVKKKGLLHVIQITNERIPSVKEKEQGKMIGIDLFAKYIKLGFAERMRAIIHSNKINNFSPKIFFSDDGRSNRFNLLKLQIVIQNCVNTLFCKIQFLSSLGFY